LENDKLVVEEEDPTEDFLQDGALRKTFDDW
jgi:hypothetical protein